MGNIVAINQPSFIPWRGYFHIIQRCDIFVLYDDVQFDRRSWRNRNIIKMAEGKSWVTVPVFTKGKFSQKINEVKINHELDWRKKILQSIYFSYKKAPFFDRYYDWLAEQVNKPWEYISDLDIHLTREIGDKLGIKTKYIKSSELDIPPQHKKLERVLEICKKLDATKYITGPKAMDYIKSDTPFRELGIELIWQKYDYPKYPQLYGNFEPNVSIIDLLFNNGDKSPEFIWATREGGLK